MIVLDSAVALSPLAASGLGLLYRLLFVASLIPQEDNRSRDLENDIRRLVIQYPTQSKSIFDSQASYPLRFA